MMNPKAILTKRKKKLRSATMEFNKKTGQYEFQIKESGRIIHREEAQEMRDRMERDRAYQDFEATELKQRAQESIERMANRDKDTDNDNT